MCILALHIELQATPCTHTDNKSDCAINSCGCPIKLYSHRQKSKLSDWQQVPDQRLWKLHHIYSIKHVFWGSHHRMCLFLAHRSKSIFQTIWLLGLFTTNGEWKHIIIYVQCCSSLGSILCRRPVWRAQCRYLLFCLCLWRYKRDSINVCVCLAARQGLFNVPVVQNNQQVSEAWFECFWSLRQNQLAIEF